VVLAGHSPPTWPWKVLTSLSQALSYPSLSSSLSIAPNLTTDAMEVCSPPLSSTTSRTTPCLSPATLTKEGMELADTMEEELVSRPPPTRWLLLTQLLPSRPSLTSSLSPYLLRLISVSSRLTKLASWTPLLVELTLTTLSVLSVTALRMELSTGS